MKDRICSELSRIEAVNKIRVLLAVESGSRAWGFASPDSDYDVRFVYIHDRTWYLSVFERRDVIEQMLPEHLDVSGWELRKTLRLFAKCNLALNEWLGSPVVYFETGFRQQLRDLIPSYFNSIAAIHHYRSMAQRSLNENLVDGQIGIKSLFYVLRPLLACRWIQNTGTQPPTEFARLVAESWVTTEEQEWMFALLQQKVNAEEAQPVLLDSARREAIDSELESYKSTAGLIAKPTRSDMGSLDDLFQAWVENSRPI